MGTNWDGESGPLNEDELLVILDIAATGIDSYGALRVFNEKRPHQQRDRKAITGAYRIAMALLSRQKGQSLSSEEAQSIADDCRYGVSPKRVKDMYLLQGQWIPPLVEEEPEDPSETVELRRWHLDRLRDSVHLIRQCLHNPHLEVESYYGPQPPLWLGRHDWALVPEAWVELTTPDFSDEVLWGEKLWQLIQHLGENPFWNHLAELKQAAQDLNTDLDEAALKLGEHDSGFRRAWEEVRGSPSWTTSDSRTPLTPNPDWDTTSPPCGDGFTQKVCKAFA
ncbi:MAG: hypothetical protein GY845_29225, partial [Planctomycetes bacterium]|nr:hypothetical protein [Planctomycetota bacterium]